MKKIILFIVLMTGLNSVAQTETLTIYNYTDCGYNFTLFLYPAGESCQNGEFQSGFTYPLVIFPNSTLTFDSYYLYGPGFGGYTFYGGATADYLTANYAAARFSSFKTNDGSGISIGILECAGTDITYSECGG